MPIDFTNPKPLYLQIVDSIKRRVDKGEFAVGQRIPSNRELAAFYDVSLITVKKALTELIRQGVLYSRVGKGTFVAHPSNPIDFLKHRTIGVVLSDLNNPFFSLILHSVESRVSENGYNLLLSNSSSQLTKEEIQISRFRALGVDGMIIASTSHIYRATETIHKLKNESFPFVMVSYIVDDDIYSVSTDHRRGAFMATEHLIQQGYQRIGYIGGEVGNLLGELRLQGFRQALQHYGRPFHEEFVYHLPMKFRDYESGYQLGRQIMPLSERPEALFVYNDMAAIGFEQAVLDQGFRVPDDVALVGFDDIERGRYAPVPLTTIHQPTEEIGRIAFEKLIRLIDHLPVETRTVLEPRLIVRATSVKSGAVK